MIDFPYIFSSVLFFLLHDSSSRFANSTVEHKNTLWFWKVPISLKTLSFKYVFLSAPIFVCLFVWLFVFMFLFCFVCLLVSIYVFVCLCFLLFACFWVRLLFHFVGLFAYFFVNVDSVSVLCVFASGMPASCC